MTVFDGANNQNTSPEGTNEDQGNQSYVQKLVTSKGEQWSDPEVIAKGKVEADNYIEDLKKQNAELQAQVEKAKKVEDLFSKLDDKASPTTSEQNQAQSQGGANESNTQTAVSEDDLQSLIENTLTKREAEATAKQNLDQVNSQLESQFGTEASATVQKKSQELGLSMERLQAIAAESPTAFFNLIGEKQSAPAPLTNGSIRTESVNRAQNSGKRNFAYYEKMRKENPREFYHAQDAMLKDRIEQGDSFYN